MSVSFYFAWYDCWIGAFWDRGKRILYICPLPCCVIKIEGNERRPRDWKWLDTDTDT